VATVAGTNSESTLKVTPINIGANSLAWDPSSQMIYLSLPSTDGSNGNAVQALNPATGSLGTNVFAGSEPNLLAVSSTGKYVYVGLDGSSTLQRLTLPDLELDIKIVLGNNSFDGPFFASDVEASPVSDETVAVVRSVNGTSPAEEGGVVIYDNAVARPNPLCGFIQPGCTSSGGELFDSIQWNADATLMFAANNEDTGFDFYTIPVTSSGFGKVTDYGGLVAGFGSNIHFDRVTKYVYDDNGSIIDPLAGTLVGTFAASGLMVPDGSIGRAFFIGQGTSGDGTYALTSFDMQRLTPIATVTISNVVGAPAHLIRWGSNGLAFTTTSNRLSGVPGSAVYVLNGSFVAPPSALPPTISANGVVALDSSSNIVQPGEWISIFGTNLAAGSLGWNGNFPTSLGGTSVTVDGKNAYLSYVGSTQINLQVPNDTTTGPVQVVVTTANGTATSTVVLAPFGPSLPLLDGKYVAGNIVRTDGSGAYGGGTYDVLGPTGTSLGYPTVAAKAGDSIELYAVGLGPTDPAVPAGKPFSGAAPVTNPVTLLINNVSVPLSFAGLSGAGLYQLNFTVPAGLGSGDVPLELTVGGAHTPKGAVFSLQ
jgi:uncharacterized protein (TIGR03437 family)